MKVKIPALKFRRSEIAYYCLFAVAFLYVLIRALTVDITFDESWTIRDVVSGGSFYSIVRFDFVGANNHILNSLLIKLMRKLGMYSLFAARLPNLVSFVFMAYYLIRITRRLQNRIWGILLFAIVIFNPFTIEFFSLARGYGLSACFLVISLFQLQELLYDHKDKRYYRALIFAALAVYANFSMLNYFAVLSGVLMVIAIRQHKAASVYLWSSGIIGVLAALCWFPIQKLMRSGELYFGGNQNIYNDTFVSLARTYCYTHENSVGVHLLLNTFLVLTVILVIVALWIARNRGFQMVLLALCIMTVLSVIVQYYLFGTLYLVERTAIIFLYLFAFLLVFSIDSIPFLAKYAFQIPLLAGIMLHFALKANFYKTLSWDFDAHTKEIVTFVEHKGKQSGKMMTLCYSWIFESSLRYHLNSGLYPHVILQKQSEVPGKPCDYKLLLDRRVRYVDDLRLDPALLKTAEIAFPEEHVYLVP